MLTRLALVATLLVAGLVLILTIGVTRNDQGGPEKAPPLPVPDQRPQPGVAVPKAALPAPEDRLNASDQAELDAWAQRVARATSVPERVLVGYGKAEMWMRSQQPNCHISWAMLAGIGRVESQHAGFGGAEVGADGRLTKPIIGIPLNGSPGVKAIPDTDGGKLDGDTQWDRAVGPMQFLPATWQRHAARAAGDGGTPDPQNIDDAALTAARYLCSSGGDLSKPDGWWKAVLTYNESVSYGQDVFSGADAYATAIPAP
ncbi:hypothetical protein YIM_04785 [Amycolatopsis sp. YIM 10]|nr:hypothetical protein YIM_04785 [Amycolatopsis sp. YIM 10]